MNIKDLLIELKVDITTIKNSLAITKMTKDFKVVDFLLDNVLEKIEEAKAEVKETE